MKKAALLIALLFISQATFAYMREYQTSDIKTLQGTGYSQDLMRMVETSRMINQGEEKDYVPFYDRHLYSTNPFRKWYQTAKRYWDPAADDGMFGIREITYQNEAMILLPSHAARYTPNDKYNRYFNTDLERLEHTGKIIKGSRGIEANPPRGRGYSFGRIDNL